MTRLVRRAAALPLLAAATVLAIVALGPPEHVSSARIRPPQVTEWCVGTFGAGEALFIKGRWHCSHEDGGFFVVTVVVPANVCSELFPDATTAVVDPDGIICT